MAPTISKLSPPMLLRILPPSPSMPSAKASASKSITLLPSSRTCKRTLSNFMPAAANLRGLSLSNLKPAIQAAASSMLSTAWTAAIGHSWHQSGMSATPRGNITYSRPASWRPASTPSPCALTTASITWAAPRPPSWFQLPNLNRAHTSCFGFSKTQAGITRTTTTTSAKPFSNPGVQTSKFVQLFLTTHYPLPTLFSTHPPLWHRHRTESHDFRAEPDSPVRICLVLYVHDARAAVQFLSLASRNFSGHPKRHFEGHAHLQRRRRGKIKSSSGDVQGFGKMLAVIRSHTRGTKPQWCAEGVTGQLSAFCTLHVVPLRARKPLTRPSHRLRRGISG